MEVEVAHPRSPEANDGGSQLGDRLERGLPVVAAADRQQGPRLACGLEVMQGGRRQSLVPVDVQHEAVARPGPQERGDPRGLGEVRCGDGDGQERVGRQGRARVERGSEESRRVHVLGDAVDDRLEACGGAPRDVEHGSERDERLRPDGDEEPCGPDDTRRHGHATSRIWLRTAATSSAGTSTRP
ncbi:hypothetical protein GCM10009710_04510 [Aeromicrobium alkaliterrae]|uniref:Uncharacterized protein n=1 Tax=Aeromicrobium alkaliterrae TaxID=302168 RepID=A0ABN2JJ99_9ACTN